MSENLSAFFYLIASVCFILALKDLASAKTARRGNQFAILGMGLAILTTLLSPMVVLYQGIFSALILGAVIGIFVAKAIKMTALPQLVAAFHSLVGLSAVFVAAAVLVQPDAFGVGFIGDIRPSRLIEIGLGGAIGALTFTGSLVAFAKLQGILTGKPHILPMHFFINIGLGIAILSLLGLLLVTESYAVFSVLIIVALVLGVLLIIPIGGADMPVIISMLNSYSGWAAAGIGFTLANNMLVITGALVGSSGAILSYIMCKGMNRSFVNVIFGGYGSVAQEKAASSEDKNVKAGSPEDAAFLLKNSQNVIVVPGYGMAVAHAQHAIKELSQLLKEESIGIKFAIHPVAGRMPGHMNVLLAEAGIDYENVYELEDINSDFQNTDVVLVIGANDVTNPAAKTDPQSPIYGMPILDVENAKTVFFIKRSLSAGYAGVDNELFYRENTYMLFGDAKKMTETIVKSFKDD